MSEKKYWGPHATLPELQAFCNKVRQAGGGNLLHELLPSVPKAHDTCLIAKNLNFNCSVCPRGYYIDAEPMWVMLVSDPELRGRIAGALSLETKADGIILPRPIGRTANAFDQFWTEAVTHERHTEITINLAKSEFGSLIDVNALMVYVGDSYYTRITIIR